MLLDDAAYEEVLFWRAPADRCSVAGVLHIVCGTISVGLSQRLTLEHASRGIDLVGAPVIGSAIDARDGRLRIVAAGADKAVARALPLLAAFSKEIIVAGHEPHQALPGTCLVAIDSHCACLTRA